MWTDYYTKIHPDLELEKLLFAGEIARRKVVDFLRKNSDGRIGLLDEYSSLPIYCVVAMIKELVKHGIRIPDFGCFSRENSTLRENSIKRTIQLYSNLDTEVTVDNIQWKVNELIERQNWESMEEL